MGTKAAMVVFSENDPRKSFRVHLKLNRGESRRLAEKFFGSVVEEVRTRSLDDAVWPAPGIMCVAHFGELEIICSRELGLRQPSQLTDRIRDLAGNKRAYGVFMHGVEDWAAFAVWSSGRLVRSISLSPEGGVIEDLGERMEFEEPFWQGKRPLKQSRDYPLPFHPVEFGNEALKTFFGFILEGWEGKDCFDPEEVDVIAYRRRVGN
ncbi:hypothetical protein JOF41_003546 [Saccharothrix coeruleofusca]|uniref:DUF6928 family protein n=1 Tax=Saccharothrix coeruleofusca TaxID=33919 RepID=UPI001AE21323|nr:hypothetical protein [Saccharothrix coeruleofusca]MBP2337368.1 hypothetical protein [Saccharothrix coeruleofusca]